MFFREQVTGIAFARDMLEFDVLFAHSIETSHLSDVEMAESFGREITGAGPVDGTLVVIVDWRWGFDIELVEL